MIIKKKVCIFAKFFEIGGWCNGNIAVSKTVVPGSNPGGPANNKEYKELKMKVKMTIKRKCKRKR